MQLATSKINHVCMDYLNNQKFENLCSELSFVRPIQHQVSVHAIRNGRRKMEDRHVVLQDLNTICSLHVIISFAVKVVSYCTHCAFIDISRMVFPQAIMQCLMVMLELMQLFMLLLNFIRSCAGTKNYARTLQLP
jgi:hypothetical protein